MVRVSISNILKKPKQCASYLSTKLGVSRRSVFTSRKSTSSRQERHAWKRNKVVSFLMQSENSTSLAGKHNTLRDGCIQKYTLNDTMVNLFNRFKQENLTVQIGQATFSKMHPSWMKPINWATGRQCLCHVHQNAALKLKAIKNSCHQMSFLETMMMLASIRSWTHCLKPHNV